jgi:hypothetical protein
MYITVRKYIIMSKKMKVISLKKKNFKIKISSTKLWPKIEGRVSMVPTLRSFQRDYTPYTPSCETLVVNTI